MAGFPYPSDLPGLLAAQEAIVAELEKRRIRARGPENYTRFVTNTCKVTLTEAQYQLCHVAFDGGQPWGNMGQQLFGDIPQIPAEARSVLVAVCGARSGKTYILGGLRMLHLGLTVDLSTLAPGEEGFCYLVAPSIALAHQAMRYVRGAVEASSQLSSMIMGKPSRDALRLKRPDGRIVRIEVRAASRGGASVRAGSTCGALLDESAFFRSESYAVNDEEIFKAIAPRLLPGGQIVIASTPWTETGLLYESFKKNFGHPIDAIATRAPTLLMLNNARNREAYERERRDNPENADREFDAHFVGAGAEAFFDPRWIDSSVDMNLRLPLEARPGDEVKFGCDLGFASDSAALVGVHTRDGIHTTSEICELRPTKQERLRFSDVIEHFADQMRAHKATYVMADKHHREAVWDYLDQHSMGLIDAPNDPADAFVVAKSKLHQGLCKLPNHPRFLAQLREVRVRRGVGGKVHIIQPRIKVADGRMGSHGDIVSAWVLAMYQISGESVPYAAPAPGSPEHWKAVADDIRERRRKEVQRDVMRPQSGWRRWFR